MDARLRHPIALVECGLHGPVPSGGARTLDDRTINQIISFSQRYQRRRSRTDFRDRAAEPRALATCRLARSTRSPRTRALGRNAPVAVSHYPVENRLASPVRLSFRRHQGDCHASLRGLAEDLASGSSTKDGEQELLELRLRQPGHARGQVADPRDIAAPQGETPADAAMRMRRSTTFARADPATTWTTKNSSIGSVGN